MDELSARVRDACAGMLYPPLLLIQELELLQLQRTEELEQASASMAAAESEAPTR